MGQPPAVVIIARHGARLDASDKQWHLTSPTPYDPPLTYGGWTQSRALGARIASLLHTRETSHGSDATNGAPRKTNVADNNATNGEREHKERHGGRRKHKVIIHTSPFLRCVQTSIAISAGIGQYQESSQGNRHLPTSKPHMMHSGSPRLHSVDHGKIARLAAIVEPPNDSIQGSQRRSTDKRNIRKSQLRVDAFLGEWLSPDYFDSITPPPSSVMMVAAAKADLLRPGEDVEIIEGISRTASGFPGGWRSGWSGLEPNASTDSDDEGPLSDLSGLGQALPQRIRASSHSSAGIGGSKANHKGVAKINTVVNHEQGGYTPPTPNYAISPSDSIPRGYVAHARDACVNVDYQWDSMRPPLDWGNGGEYGEEWSSMHKRFRKGLHNMILWYRTHECPKGSFDGNGPSKSTRTEQDDDDTDTILILVTHGAGCNALIGALTNQPVLLDVGMASLTMAVRKDISTGSAPPTRSRRRSSIDLGISEDYDLRLVASTEHLRAGANPLSIPQLQPSPRRGSQSQSMYRNRFGSTPSNTSTISSVDTAFSLSETQTRASSIIGGGGGAGDVYYNLSISSTTTTTSTGLWSKPSADVADGVMTAAADRQHTINGKVENHAGNSPSLENHRQQQQQQQPQPPLEDDDDALLPLHTLPNRTNSQRGLWGATPQAVAKERERGAKRRWTVNEQG